MHQSSSLTPRADGTAMAGEDYDSATETVTFEPGETEKIVTLTVHGDTTIEATGNL